MGALENKVLNEGIHFKIPFMQKIEEVSIRPISNDYPIEVGRDGAITKDNQTIGADVELFYRYDENKLVSMWKNYGEAKIEAITKSILRESFKEVIGKYTIYDVAQQQEEIRTAAVKIVATKIEKYPISFVDLKIGNYDWSEDFDIQIKQTMIRSQQVKQGEQDLMLTEKEQQKKVKIAESEKQALITRAEGEKEAARLMAEAKALEGEGIRKYNEELAKTWEIEQKKLQLEIEKLKAEKWNGQYVPNNMYGPIPFDGLGGVKGG